MEQAGAACSGHAATARPNCPRRHSWQAGRRPEV